MRIAFTGGRNYNNLHFVVSTLLYFEPSFVIVGCARGADKLVRDTCKAGGIDYKVFYADWEQHGKSAGHIRNSTMIREGRPDLLIAFAGGAGTQNCIQAAKAYGVPHFDTSLLPQS